MNPTPSSIIQAAAVLGMFANTILIVGIAWRGGRLLGNMEEGMKNTTKEMARVTAELNGFGERMMRMFDALEARVGRLEGRH